MRLSTPLLYRLLRARWTASGGSADSCSQAPVSKQSAC